MEDTWSTAWSYGTGYLAVDAHERGSAFDDLAALVVQRGLEVETERLGKRMYATLVADGTPPPPSYRSYMTMSRPFFNLLCTKDQAWVLGYLTMVFRDY